MATFDPSPRATKKRKTATAADESTSAMVSRALRTVRQAVYGKAASPKIEGKSFTEELKVPAKVQKEKSRGRKSGGGNDIEKGVNVGAGAESTKENSENRGEGAGSPSLGQGPRGLYSQRGKTVGHEGDVVAAEGLQTPTRKRKKNFQGWVYAEEGDELGQEDTQTGAVGLENGVGRLKRGRDDLTIDMNPNQLKPRKKQDTMNDVRTDENLDGPISAGKRRISRRSGLMEDKGVNVEATAKTTSPRKRGRPKKQPSTAPASDDGEGKDGFHVDNVASRNTSPDELAPESQEESEQDILTETPTKKRSGKFQQARRIFVEEPSLDVREPSAPAFQTETWLDQQISTDDRAKELEAILEKSSETLAMLKEHLLSGLTGKRRLPLINLEDEHQKVKQIIEQTVLAGEGNSMLVIGSRGSGKSILVETVLSELSSDHRDDFHVVRLNGFIHTDDKLALREIWRQLGREMEVENEDLGGRSNYADTLSSLLALLAHTAEETEEDQAATARSVVFILDEFDLFASHPRQTLLYNLFDVAQSRNTPIAVLGLTTKVNVVDSLEKRVKSRFGQRYVHLSLPRSFTAYQEFCFSALKYNPSTHELLHHKISDVQQLSTTWNDYIKALFSTPPFQHFLQTLYTTTKSIPAFLNASLLPISTLSPTTIPTPTSFATDPLLPPDSKLHLLPSLSTLSLSLLISAARLDIILSSDICTFDMVYDEYVALASKSKLQSSAAGQMAIGGGSGARVCSKGVAKGAWEGLGKLELVLPAVGGSRGVGKGQMWRVDVGLEEIGGWLEGEGGRGGALGKWCREI